MRYPLDHDVFRIPVASGVQVHVERYGYGGDPVVLVHGFGTSAFLWRRVGPLIAVRQATAFAADMFGYGESDRPFDGDFSLFAQASCLDAVLTGLQLTRATVVGVDVGALVALRLAHDRPERVFRLVLIGPPPLTDVGGPEIRDLQRDSARYALRLNRGLFGSGALLRPLLEGGVSRPEAMPPALVARYMSPFLGGDGAAHLLALAGAINNEDFADLSLASIRHRTLVVRGTRDRWCTRAVAESYAEELPRGHYEHVDEVGHLVPEEAPDSLSRLIMAFLRTAETDGTDERPVAAVRNFGAG